MDGSFRRRRHLGIRIGGQRCVLNVFLILVYFHAAYYKLRGYGLACRLHLVSSFSILG